MEAVVRDRNDIKRHICDCVDASKVSVPSASSTSRRMIGNSRSSVKNTRTAHTESTNETAGADEIPRGIHTIRQPPIPKPAASPGGANKMTATLTLPPPASSRHHHR